MKIEQKVITVIALGWLGDTVTVEPLCFNIKKNYPDHKLVLFVSKPFYDLGKLMTCDEVYYYDKKDEHNGIMGILKLAKSLKNIGKVEFSFLTHTHERSMILAKLLNSKNIISLPLKSLNPLNIFINKIVDGDKQILLSTYRGQFFSDFLKHIGCSTLSLETNLQIPAEEKENTISKFSTVVPFDEEYIVLSTTSKQECNDWDIKEIEQFVKNADKKIVFVGTGRANQAAEELKTKNLNNFIDLTNQTTIMDLAVLMSKAHCCISVDTGTMHLAYLLNKPTICLFSQPVMVPQWYPSHLDNVKILVGNKYLDKKTNKIIINKEISHKDVLNILKTF